MGGACQRHPGYLWMSGGDFAVLAEDSFRGLLSDRLNAPAAERTWR